MKYILIGLAAVLALSSCSAHNTVSPQDEKIAQAIQKEGEAYLRRGNFTQALKKFLEAEKRDPEDPYLQHNLGLAYMGKDKYKLAEKHFKKAMELNPDYVAAVNSLGTAYLRQEKYDKAIEYFQKVADNMLYAKPHYAFSNMGWAYVGKNEYNRALKFFSRALDTNPEFVQAIHGKARAWLSLQQPEKAVSFLEKKIQKLPGYSVLHSDLAKAYETVYEYDKARRSWHQVLNIAPEYSSIAEEAELRLKQLE